MGGEKGMKFTGISLELENGEVRLQKNFKL